VVYFSLFSVLLFLPRVTAIRRVCLFVCVFGWLVNIRPTVGCNVRRAGGVAHAWWRMCPASAFVVILVYDKITIFRNNNLTRQCVVWFFELYCTCRLLRLSTIVIKNIIKKFDMTSSIASCDKLPLPSIP